MNCPYTNPPWPPFDYAQGKLFAKGGTNFLPPS